VYYENSTQGTQKRCFVTLMSDDVDAELCWLLQSLSSSWI